MQEASHLRVYRAFQDVHPTPKRDTFDKVNQTRMKSKSGSTVAVAQPAQLLRRVLTFVSGVCISGTQQLPCPPPLEQYRLVQM